MWNPFTASRIGQDMKTWGNVTAPLPFPGIVIDQRTDLQRQKVPQPKFAGASGGVFNNQQGGPLPDGRITEIPGQNPLAINAAPYNPTLTNQSSATGFQASNLSLQQAMGSHNASPGPASMPSWVSGMPGPWGED